MAIIYLDNQAEKALEIGDKRFFRYYSLNSAKKSLDQSSFWFSNPIEWEDPFEKLFIEAKYTYDGNSYDFPFKDRLFCICITEEDVSLASWKAYSENQIAIRFEINSMEFIKLLESQSDFDVFIGKVKYTATKKIEGKNGPKDFDLKDLFSKSKSDKDKLLLLLLKRYAFKYEKEFRIILIPKKHRGHLKGIEIPFDKGAIHKLIPQIMVGPSNDLKKVEDLKILFKKYGVKKVSHSRLISPFEPREYKL